MAESVGRRVGYSCLVCHTLEPARYSLCSVLSSLSPGSEVIFAGVAPMLHATEEALITAMTESHFLTLGWFGGAPEGRALEPGCLA